MSKTLSRSSGGGDMAALRLYQWKTLRASIFDVLFQLQQRSFYNGVYYWQHFFIFAHFVARSFDSNVFPWSERLVNAFGRSLELISLQFYSTPPDSALSVSLFILLATSLLVIAIVTVLMCYSSNLSSKSAQLITFCYRISLGICLTFQAPFLRFFTRFILCDNSQSHWSTICASNGTQTTLMIFSLPIVMILIIIIFMASLMHVNNPKAYVFTARPHNRLEITVLACNCIETLIIALAPGFPFLIAIVFVILRFTLVIGSIHFQPYIWAHFNRYKSSMDMISLWAAVCTVITTLHNDIKTDWIAALFFAGLVPVLFIGRIASDLSLQHHIRKGLAQTVDTSLLQKNDVILKIHNSYKKGVVISAAESMDAFHTELQTRFLLIQSTPEQLDRAECILLNGLKRCPQSYYLRIQYVTFLLAYRRDWIKARELCKVFNELPIDMDMRFSLHRLVRQINLVLSEMEAGNSGLTDRITPEEVNKNHTLARYHHVRSEKLVNALWTNIAEGNTNPHLTIALIEQVYISEEIALRTYQFLFENVPGNLSIVADYASFIADVKKDKKAASSILDQAEMLIQAGGSGGGNMDDGASGDHNNKNNENKKTKPQSSHGSESNDNGSSFGGSSKNSNQNMSQRSEAAETEKQQRVRSLKVKMQIVSLLMLLGVAAVFMIYSGFNDEFELSLMNVTDSGARRRFVISLLLHSRQMLHLTRRLHHLNCSLENNINNVNGGDECKSIHDAYEVEKSKLTTSYEKLWNIHSLLSHGVNRPHDPMNQAWIDHPITSSNVNYADRSCTLLNIGDEMCTSIHPTTSADSSPYVLNASTVWNDKDNVIQTLSGYDYIAALCYNAAIVSQSSKLQFQSFNAATNPWAFPELYFILSNSPDACKQIDYSTILYQIEAEEWGRALQIMVLLSSASTFIAEVLIIIIVFRPAVLRVFVEFNAVAVQFLLISSMVAQKILLATRKNFKRRQVQREKRLAKERLAVQERKRQQRFVEQQKEQQKQPNGVDDDGSNENGSSVGGASRGSGLMNENENDDDFQENQIYDVELMDQNHINDEDEPMENDALLSVNENINESDGKNDTEAHDISHGEISTLQVSHLAHFGELTASATPVSDLDRELLNDEDDDVNSENSENDMDEDDLEAIKESIDMDEESDGKRGSKRLQKVNILYGICLAMTAILFTLFAYFGITSSKLIRSYPSLINNADRLAYLSHRITFYAMEIARSNEECLECPNVTLKSSFEHSKLEHINSMENITCNLQSSAMAMDQVHRFVLNEPFEIDLKSNCSFYNVFTNDQSTLLKSFKMPTEFSQSEEFGSLFFRGNCLSDVPWDRDAISPNSLNDRMKFYSNDLSNDKCTLYDKQDAVLSNGMHRLLLARESSGINVARTPNHLATWTNVDVTNVIDFEFGSPEVQLAFVKTTLFLQYEAVTIVNDAIVKCAFIACLVAILLFGQYLVLGNHMEQLLTENISMGIIIRRMVEQQNKMKLKLTTQKGPIKGKTNNAKERD